LDEDTQKLRIFGGGIGTTLSRKNPLKQLFNFDSSKKDRLKPHNNTSLNSVGQTTPANRSASMQNLAALNTSLPNHGPSSIAPSAKILVNGIPSSFTGSSNPQPPHQSSSLVTRFEIFERFKLALENYKKFSYVVFIEYECVLRTSSVLIFHRQFIDVDVSFFNCFF
jgi:hypothetical protein